MAKRLTEKQKEEIIKCFEDGKNINLLSQEFNCTKLTVIRNLKKNLGELKYKELINKSNKHGKATAIMKGHSKLSANGAKKWPK